MTKTEGALFNLAGQTITKVEHQGDPQLDSVWRLTLHLSDGSRLFIEAEYGHTLNPLRIVDHANP